MLATKFWQLHHIFRWSNFTIVITWPWTLRCILIFSLRQSEKSQLFQNFEKSAKKVIIGQIWRAVSFTFDLLGELAKLVFVAFKDIFFKSCKTSVYLISFA